jgi:hypothetical protein
MQLLCFLQVFACICPGGVALVQGGACMCAGGALCGFLALVGVLRSLLEHGFVSDVSSRCPCLRGPKLIFFR